MLIDSQYSIRNATTKDAAGILECLRLAFEPYRSSYTSGAYEDTIRTADTISERLSATQVYVAVTDTNQVIGAIACSLICEKEGHLRGMAVLPQWQSSGVAKALLKTAEAALSALGCSIMTLDTTAPLERAIRFYQRNGYRPTGTVTDFFGMSLYEYAKTIV